MFSDSLIALADAANPEQAWTKIIHPYQKGEKIIIEPNLNNTQLGYSQAIMTSPQVIQALVESLLEAGYPADDIIIYDLTAYDNHITAEMFGKFGLSAAFPNEKRGFTGDIVAKVAGKLHFGPSAPDTKAPIHMQKKIKDENGGNIQCFIPKVLSKAKHLINVLVFKTHQFILQSSSLKNHFGTVRFSNHNSFPVVLHGDDIEWLIADINANRHIRYKIRLIIVDALLGAGCFYLGDFGRRPTRWRTLSDGDTQASFFFSKDPVALESALADAIIKEQQSMGYKPYSHDYLHIASRLELGVHEHHDANERYFDVEYLKLVV